MVEGNRDYMVFACNVAFLVGFRQPKWEWLLRGAGSQQ